MENTIYLIYQGIRLANKRVVYTYAEDGKNPIGFSELIAGYEKIGDKVFCTQSGDNIQWNYATANTPIGQYPVGEWFEAERKALREYQKIRSGFLNKIVDLVKPAPRQRLLAKSLGEFIIIPYLVNATFALANFISKSKLTLSVVIALDDTADDTADWFFTVTIINSTESHRNELVSFINNQL